MNSQGNILWGNILPAEKNEFLFAAACSENSI